MIVRGAMFGIVGTGPFLGRTEPLLVKEAEPSLGLTEPDLQQRLHEGKYLDRLCPDCVSTV
jgi:hypothetical protein